MNTYIVTYHDELDGDRIAVFAVQADSPEEATAEADKEAAEWEFSEEYTTVETTLIETPHPKVVTVFAFSR